MKILIIDDARWQRSNLTKILLGAGHEVLQATNGHEALALLDERPEAVVCDLLMPELDGFGFLEAVRQRSSRPPIVIASADIQQSSRDRCVALGAADFLPKPYKAADILAVLAKVTTP